MVLVQQSKTLGAVLRYSSRGLLYVVVSLLALPAWNKGRKQRNVLWRPGFPNCAGRQFSLVAGLRSKDIWDVSRTQPVLRQASPPRPSILVDPRRESEQRSKTKQPRKGENCVEVGNSRILSWLRYCGPNRKCSSWNREWIRSPLITTVGESWP